MGHREAFLEAYDNMSHEERRDFLANAERGRQAPHHSNARGRSPRRERSSGHDHHRTVELARDTREIARRSRSRTPVRSGGERSERSERRARSEHDERGERSARSEHDERSKHSGRSEPRARSAHGERSERTARSEHDERGERSARSEHDRRSERTARSEHGRSERSVRIEHLTATTHASQQRGHVSTRLQEATIMPAEVPGHLPPHLLAPSSILSEALSDAKAVITAAQDTVSAFAKTINELNGSALRPSMGASFLNNWEQLKRSVRQASQAAEDALNASRGANLDGTLDTTRAELRSSKELLDGFFDDLLTIHARHKRLDSSDDGRAQRWKDALKPALVPSWVAYGAPPPPPPMPAAHPAPVAAPAPAAEGVDFEAQLADMVARHGKMLTNFLTEQAAVAQLEKRNRSMAIEIADLKRRLADQISSPSRSIERNQEQRSNSSAKE
jgi:hypothetical protein